MRLIARAIMGVILAFERHYAAYEAQNMSDTWVLKLGFPVSCKVCKFA